MKKLKWFVIGCCLIGILSLGFYSLIYNSGTEGVVRIGYTNSPLLAPLFLAEEQKLFEANEVKVELKRFGTGRDIGFALLSRKIDAGFIETETAIQLLNVQKQEGIKIAGTVIYPFGATVVVRKDLNIRLGDLTGLKVAAENEDCVLVRQFKKDGERLGLELGKINFVYMPFHLMLPALEAREVDAIITKGAYAMLAELAGHQTLYQNWEVKPGDDPCCPAYLANVEYLLLVRGLDSNAVSRVVKALEESSQASPDAGRKAISRHTGFKESALNNFPVATFARPDEDFKKEFREDYLWKKQP